MNLHKWGKQWSQLLVDIPSQNVEKKKKGTPKKEEKNKTKNRTHKGNCVTALTNSVAAVPRFLAVKAFKLVNVRGKGMIDHPVEERRQQVVRRRYVVHREEHVTVSMWEYYCCR